VISFIFGIKEGASCSNSGEARQILRMALIYILEELYFYKRVSHEY